MIKNNIHRILAVSIACAAYSQFIHADLLKEGRNAFLNYDFERAGELYAKYEQGLKKNPNEDGEILLEKFYRQLEIAENSLDNVQKVEIIDRLDVPAADFFKAIKLPSGGGMLLSPNSSVIKNRPNDSDFVFTTESGDMMIWSEVDENSLGSLMQSELLLDGTWETPVKIGENLNEGGSVKNPFLLTDGVTLYFAGNGEGSMGGYDLFVATKDPVSGEFRQPIGVGYPFNSPNNEYMMAIDEENGIGWWVTDRNGLEGKVSIYIFKTNDVRSNYQLDEEDDIIPYARLDDITITQSSDTDYAKIIKDIDARSKAVAKSDNSDFIFPLPGGRLAKKLTDFKSTTARKDMEQYLKTQAEYNSFEDKLRSLRIQYHQTDRKKSSSAALRNQITDLEKRVDLQRDRLKQMRNTIISAELNK